jgi:hypothetical protein
MKLNTSFHDNRILLRHLFLMNSKLSKAKPSVKSLSASRKSQFSGKALVTKPKAEPVNPMPIVTKKPLTKHDKELLEACETGDIDQVSNII